MISSTEINSNVCQNFVDENGRFKIDFEKEIFENQLQIILYHFSYNVFTYELLSLNSVIKNPHYKIELNQKALAKHIDVFNQLNGTYLKEISSDILLNTRIVAEIINSNGTLLTIGLGIGMEKPMIINTMKYENEYIFEKVFSNFIPQIEFD